jgi:hypothetical protein
MKTTMPKALLSLALLLALLPLSASAQVFVTSPDTGSDFLAEFSTSLTNQGSGTVVPGVTDSAGVATILGSDLLVGNGSTVSEYGFSGGTALQSFNVGGTVAALLTNGNDLYVAEGNAVKEYSISGNTASQLGTFSLSVSAGSTINALAISGTTLFAITSYESDTVSEFNATTGASLSVPLTITLQAGASSDIGGLAIYGNNLLVVNRDGTGSDPADDGSVTAYNLGTNAQTLLVQNLQEAGGIAVLGSDIYVTEDGNGSGVSGGNGTPGSGSGELLEYGLNAAGTATTSMTTIGTGLEYPQAVAAVPEPYSLAMGVIVVALFGVLRLRARTS